MSVSHEVMVFWVMVFFCGCKIISNFMGTLRIFIDDGHALCFLALLQPVENLKQFEQPLLVIEDILQKRVGG
jgi:hypothetical protein